MMPTPDAMTPSGDASMTEGGSDSSMPAQPRVCEAANVIDLSMAGMRMGATTRYTGTTANAANNAMIAIPTGCIGGGMAIRQVAHTYRVNAMGFLRVSTANMGTPTGMGGHDTVVWVQDRCDTRGTMSLGCNDDATGVASTVVTNRLVMAGQTVTVVVATLAEAAGGAGLPYELTVEEVPPVMMGGACNPGAANVCTTNTTCVGSGQLGTCVANGSLGAQCRAMNQCDMGLECIEVQTDAFRCLRRAPMGGACDAVTVCPDNADCLPDGMMPGGATSGRCRARGTEGGLCAGNTMATCGMGLACTGDAMRTGTCVRDVMMGAACDPTGISTRCAMGTSCARAMTGYTCQANGSAAGTTCVDGAMRCTAMGLTCSAAMGAGVCRSTAMAGGMCDPRFGTISCAGMEVCSADTAVAGVCRAAVAEGAGMNNTPAMAEAARPLPLVIRGGVTPAGDVDCYGFTLPAGRGIVAQVSDGAGGCPAMADSVLFILDSMGRTVATNDDAFNLCSFIDTRENPFTRMLPAGNYVACLRAYAADGTIMNYSLSVTAPPAM